MHTIELVEDLLDILFLDTLSCITDTETEVTMIVPCADIDIQRFFGLTVFDSIIHQIGDGILEVHLIDIHGRVDSLNLCIYLSTRMFHAQGECGGDILYHLVEIQFLLLKHHALLVEHRHLQHLLHEEAQAFRLVGNHATQVLRHLLRLRHAVVVHHLCCQ